MRRRKYPTVNTRRNIFHIHGAAAYEGYLCDNNGKKIKIKNIKYKIRKLQ